MDVGRERVDCFVDDDALLLMGRMHAREKSRVLVDRKRGMSRLESLSRIENVISENENLRWIDLLCCCLLAIVTSLTLSYIISYNQHSIFYPSPSTIATTIWHHELLELTATAAEVEVCTIIK